MRLGLLGDVVGGAGEGVADLLLTAGHAGTSLLPAFAEAGAHAGEGIGPHAQALLIACFQRVLQLGMRVLHRLAE
ncbi:hypothetical protein D3C71_1291710 [compost metagenome]